MEISKIEYEVARDAMDAPTAFTKMNEHVQVLRQHVEQLQADRDAARRERDEAREMENDAKAAVDLMANETVYHGNSVSHWYAKAQAYKDAFSKRDEALKQVERLQAEVAHLRTALTYGDETIGRAACLFEASQVAQPNPSPAEPSAAKDGVSLYPTDAELVEIGHKAKAAHPNDPEQMFYASMRMACDWSHARLKPFKYHVRFPDGEEEYFDGDDKERLAEVLQDDAAVNYINTPTVTPLYKRAAPAASSADDGGKCRTCGGTKVTGMCYQLCDRGCETGCKSAGPCPDCTPNTREEKQCVCHKPRPTVICGKPFRAAPGGKNLCVNTINRGGSDPDVCGHSRACHGATP